MKDTSPKHDNFLADAIKPKDRRVSYMDGLRFGLGFFMAGIIWCILLGGLAWGIIAGLKLH